MAINKYLSVIPESLVLSMLEPKKFGTYLAAGTEKRAHEHAVYFDLKEDFNNEYFDLQSAEEQCVPHENGEPKHSVYASIYRVLEHVGLESLNSLWLATKDGRVLELQKGKMPETFDGKYHLYQELCPVSPLIVSSLNPKQFCNFITDPNVRISVPKICFLELELGELAEDPEKGSAYNLPYSNIGHLKDCVREVASHKKTTKTVDRIWGNHVPYRVIKSGFYAGDQDGMVYYPFPSQKELETEHHEWWRSATLF